MKEIRFLVFTDLHADMIHDAAARMERIAAAAREQQVQFVIQLGDLQYPDGEFLRANSPESLRVMAEKRPWALGRDDEKKAVCALLAGIGRPVYHVLGNHDLHVCDKRTMCGYLGMPAPYYSFAEGQVRFIVLDTNWIRTENGKKDMAFGNHEGYGDKHLKYLSEEQFAWLERELKGSGEPCVLLSHASLADPLSGIHEQERLMEILRGNARILLAMNGHGHVDGLRVAEGIPFWDVNSASYHFMGDEYPAVRYSRKLCGMYPGLMETAPYYDPLYAIVEIREDGIRIRGTQSAFVGPAPQELGMPESENDYPPCAQIRDRFLSASPWKTADKPMAVL